jgi:hypothetical protein
MIRRLTTQLPAWARLENPALRYVLGTQRVFTWRGFFSILLATVIIVVGVAVFGIVTQQDLGQSLSEQLMNILFWPTVFAQVVLSIMAILYTTSAIGAEKRRQTWDKLRTTGSGTGLTLRAQWSAAVFYRPAGLLAVVYLVRLVLVGALVYDLTAFRGDYLAYLTGPITPEIPVVLGVVTLALVMTASFVLPLTGMGLDAALGLLASTFVTERIWVVMVQIILVIARVAITAVMMMLMIIMMETVGGGDMGLPQSWLVLVGFGAFGDWGLRYLHLAFLGEVWALIPYSVLLGLALLAAAFVQALITDGLLAFAIRRAERRE